MKLTVKIPVLLEVETYSVDYGCDVSDFLKVCTGKRVKYTFVGVLKRYSIFLFYTNKTDKEYKKLLKEAKKEIAEWEASEIEEEEEAWYCKNCGTYCDR